MKVELLYFGGCPHWQVADTTAGLAWPAAAPRVEQLVEALRAP